MIGWIGSFSDILEKGITNETKNIKSGRRLVIGGIISTFSG